MTEKELVLFFRNTFRPGTQSTVSWGQQATADMSQLLKLYPADTIKKNIIDYQQKHPNKYIYHVWEIFPEIAEPKTQKKATGQSKGSNLLQESSFYYHNELRQMPPVPRCIIKPDGTAEWIIEKFYLEMSKSYSLEDLLDYYESKIDTYQKDKTRDIGALRYLVTKHGIDVVLYAIDAATDKCVGGITVPPRTPMDLQNYIGLGMKRLEVKKAEARELGLDRIVPKTV